MSHSKHILVIRFSAMGDVAMSVPVLKSLLEHYPELKVTVVTKSFFKPLFDNLDVTVYEADLKAKHKGVLGLYKLSRELKVLEIDGVADLHDVLRSKILKLFLPGLKKATINKGRAEKKALTSGQRFQQLKTTHQRYADVFKELGYSLDLSKPSFVKPQPLSADLKSYITDSNLPIIGVAPFAAHTGKMYPLNQMQEVIQELSKFCNMLLFGGGPNEIEVLATYEQKFDNTVSVAGKISFNEELQLISNLDLMLAMDSGNGHLAAIFGVKVLTIWGVTHPYAGFAPFNQPKDHQLIPDKKQFPLIPTSVYGNTFPAGYEKAAASIPSKEIIAKIKTSLSLE